jgi:TolB-like protein
MRIAILDLQPIEVSESISKIVSDLLRTELFKTKLFTIIERSQMNEILKEQEFQLSGCTETECAVQAGKLLSAHKVLVGTVNKLGAAFIINARIIDVEKGVMEFGESTKVASEAELDNGCRVFAKKLATMIKESSEAEIEKKKEEKEKVQYYYPLRKYGYISLGVSIISLGLGYYFNMQAEKNYNDSLKLYDEYKNALADFDSKWKAYEDKYDASKSKATLKSEKVSFIINPDKFSILYKF